MNRANSSVTILPGLTRPTLARSAIYFLPEQKNKQETRGKGLSYSNVVNPTRDKVSMRENLNNFKKFDGAKKKLVHRLRKKYSEEQESKEEESKEASLNESDNNRRNNLHVVKRKQGHGRRKSIIGVGTRFFEQRTRDPRRN